MTPRCGSDHDDRDRVVQAFALSTPYDAAIVLGLTPAKGARRSARSIPVLCPWHSESTPGGCLLTIVRGRLVARCHSCHGGGDVLHIVAAIEGLNVRGDFSRVLARAGEIVGVEVRRPGRRAPEAQPLTPLDVARRETAEARRAEDAARAEARTLRQEAAWREAELLARCDVLEAVADGLAEGGAEVVDALTAARLAPSVALLPALRAAAESGSRSAVLAAVEALADAMGAE